MEKPKNFKEVARQWQARQDGKMELDSADVKCPTCGTVWKSSLSSDFFLCQKCGKTLVPNRHVVVESETEVN